MLQSWLDIGDKVYQHSPTSFNVLPSNLYGADWLQIIQKEIDEPVSFIVYEDVDVFVGYKKSALAATKIAAKTVAQSNELC